MARRDGEEYPHLRGAFHNRFDPFTGVARCFPINILRGQKPSQDTHNVEDSFDLLWDGAIGYSALPGAAPLLLRLHRERTLGNAAKALKKSRFTVSQT